MTTTPPDPTDLYRAPSSPIGPVVASTADPEMVSLRLRYVRHERAVRTLGLLMYALAGGYAVLLTGSFPRAGRPAQGAFSIGYLIGYGSALVLFIAFLVKLGRDIRRLRGWARWFLLGASALMLICLAIALFVRAWSSPDPEQVGGAAGAMLIPALILIYQSCSARGLRVAGSLFLIGSCLRVGGSSGILDHHDHPSPAQRRADPLTTHPQHPLACAVALRPPARSGLRP